jgi:hypothetical protein
MLYIEIIPFLSETLESFPNFKLCGMYTNSAFKELNIPLFMAQISCESLLATSRPVQQSFVAMSCGTI